MGHTLRRSTILAVICFVLSACTDDRTSTARGGAAGIAPNCEAMLAAGDPQMQMTSAATQAAKPASEGKTRMPALPEHCVVTGVIEPRTGVDGVRYGIGFELRLPRDWNGRLQFMGVGGTAGYIPAAIGAQSGDAEPALAQGYAVVTSDMGHKGRNASDASFGLDPQARIDWGYRAVDVVTVAAKSLLERYYGQRPARSYFVGCSGGGRQAMMAALRNPGHFDGIVAGAPILEQHVAQIGSMQVLQEFSGIAPKDAQGRPILSGAFSDQDLKLIDDAVVGKCDPLDGLRDGIVDNHTACTFDVRTLACKGEKTPACLSSAQVTALERVMEGPFNSKGERLYHGRPWDSGFKYWRPSMLGTSKTAVPNARRAVNLSVKLVFMTPPAPDFDYLSFNFDRDPQRMSASAAFTATNSTDWHEFRRRGGKAIVYAGISDPLLNTNGVLDWYRRMLQEHGGVEETQRFARYFHVPGMGHCRGGDATDRFDHFAALVAWVERGQAPEYLLAQGDAFPGRTRPICAYPKQTRYRGTGSIDDASNFMCVDPR